MQDSLIGSVVGGHRVERLVGRGGMGLVYEAVELGLGRTVALKVIAPELAGDGEFRKRFVAEARVAASIDHPNVLPIYGAGEDDGVLFLAMRLVVGDDLGAIVRREGPLAPERAAAIVMQVAHALDAAHGRGLVHRDVKPANVLVADSHAYLTDFGLAKEFAQHGGRTRTGVVVGTPDYLAPEQIRGDAVGPCTDVYALGCVLFFALTGRVVFPLDEAETKMWAHLRELPASVSALRDDVPVRFDGVLARALAKSPAERFGSASALGEAAVAAASSASAAVTSIVTSLPGSARRRRSALPAPLRVPSRFVGRAEQLASLARAVDQAVDGRTRLVLISGPAGIGKSALVARAATDANGMRVLYGRCDEDPLGPYQPFADALHELLLREPSLVQRDPVSPHVPELSRLLPELGTGPQSSEPDRRRLFEAVAAVLLAVADGQGLLLVIDDLHWADPPTLTILRWLVQRATVSMLVMATSRDAGDRAGALRELAVELRRDDAFERVRLEGLDDAATAELIAARAARSPHPHFVRWMHGHTGGNPFFVEEVLRTLADTDGLGLVSTPDHSALSTAAVPEGVKELVGQRLARFSDSTVQALQIAAVTGAEFTLKSLANLVGASEPSLRALEEASSAGMVAEVPGGRGRFAFSHGLIRQAIYEGMSTTRRAVLHARIADQLESDALADTAALAHHGFQARHLTGGEKAVQWLITAAEQAAHATAWEDELAFYGRAVQTLDETDSRDDETRCRVLLALADREMTHGGDYLSTFRRAAGVAKHRGWAAMLARAAIGRARVWEYGTVDREAAAMLEDALVLLPDHDSRERAEVMARLSQTLLFDELDDGRRDALSREAIQMARRLGDSSTLLIVLGARSRILEGPDATDERIRLLAEAANAVRDDYAEHHGFLHATLNGLHLELCDVDAARHDINLLATQLARHRLRDTYWDGALHERRAVHALLDGDLGASERYAQAAFALYSRDPDLPAVRLALLLPLRREQDRSDELLADVAAQASKSSAHAPWRAALSLLHAYGGLHVTARSELHDLVAGECAAIARRDEWLPAVAMLAETCAELGDLHTAPTLERLLAPYTDRLAIFFCACCALGPIAWPLGRLLSLLDRHDEAIAMLERAVDISDAIPAPIWSCWTRLHLAAALDQRGEPHDSAAARLRREEASVRAQPLDLPRLDRHLQLAGTVPDTDPWNQ